MSYSNGLLSDQSYQTANKYVQRGLITRRWFQINGYGRLRHAK